MMMKKVKNVMTMIGRVEKRTKNKTMRRGKEEEVQKDHKKNDDDSK